MRDRRNPSLSSLTPNPQKGESGRLSLFPESQVSQGFSLSNSSLSPLSVSSSPLSPSVLSCEGSVQSSSIDLIQGDNCARNVDEELVEFLRELKRLVQEEEEGGSLYFLSLIHI